MQTFLPMESFSESLECLDYQRLGKQRLEADWLIRTLEENGPRRHHPAAKMWEGHVAWLIDYYNETLTQWISRGYKNTMEFRPKRAFLGEKPWWLGYQPFHDSHKSNLLRKKPGFYGIYLWGGMSPDLEYIWPHPTERKYILGKANRNWIEAPLP